MSIQKRLSGMTIERSESKIVIVGGEKMRSEKLSIDETMALANQ